MRAQGWMAVVVGAALVGAAGCGWQTGGGAAASSGAVAVIDLDEIAARLGSDKQIAESINQRQGALRQKLVELAQSYTQQIEEQRKTLPADQAKQAEVTVASWQQQANANLNQVKQQAAQDLANHRTRLMDQFREHVKPVARRVAQRRGLTVIVTKNDSVVFDYVSSAEITNEVVDELLANSAATAPPVTAPQASVPQATAPQAAAAPAATVQQAVRPDMPQR